MDQNLADALRRINKLEQRVSDLENPPPPTPPVPFRTLRDPRRRQR